jgi:hypothetical protein
VDANVYGPLEELPRSLQSPTKIHPSFITIVDCKHRTSAPNPSGIDVSWLEGECPMIVAFIRPFGDGVENVGAMPAAKARLRLKTEDFTVDDFLRRSTHALSDAVCWRAPCLQSAAICFLAWVRSCAETVQSHVSPTAIVVIDQPGGESSDSMAMTAAFHNACAALWEEESGRAAGVDERVKACFHNVLVAGDTGTDDVTLCRRLSQHFLLSRRRREAAQHLWDLKTMALLFESACRHFANGLSQKFDFVRALRARGNFPLPWEHWKYSGVDGWIRLRSNSRTLEHFVAPVLAHAFLYDSLCIGDHRKSENGHENPLPANSPRLSC